eukprot:c19174_g1_i1 orf=802-1008(+)
MKCHPQHLTSSFSSLVCSFHRTTLPQSPSMQTRAQKQIQSSSLETYFKHEIRFESPHLKTNTHLRQGS